MQIANVYMLHFRVFNLSHLNKAIPKSKRHVGSDDVTAPRRHLCAKVGLQ